MKRVNNAHRDAVVIQPTPKRGVVDVQKSPVMAWTHTIEGYTSCNCTVVIRSLSPHNKVHFWFPTSKLVLRRDCHRASLHTDLVILKTYRHGPRKPIQREAADPTCFWQPVIFWDKIGRFSCWKKQGYGYPRHLGSCISVSLQWTQVRNTEQ